MLDHDRMETHRVVENAGFGRTQEEDIAQRAVKHDVRQDCPLHRATQEMCLTCTRAHELRSRCAVQRNLRQLVLRATIVETSPWKMEDGTRFGLRISLNMPDGFLRFEEWINHGTLRNTM